MKPNELRTRILNKIGKMAHCDFFYHTHYGLKMVKGRMQEPAIKFDRFKVDLCAPEELYLGVDGLYDNYSHTGKNILSSPHYELMVACSEDKLSNSVYVHLENIGALDSRDLFKKTSEKHLNEFYKAKAEIENDTYKPIVFYVVDNNKYIYDGKHRAALCAYLGLKAKCVEVSPNEICSKYYNRLYKDMKNHPMRYSSLQCNLVRTITGYVF